MTAIRASVLILVAMAGLVAAPAEAGPAPSVAAVELFVSPDGRDSWPGTKSRRSRRWSARSAPFGRGRRE